MRNHTLYGMVAAAAFMCGATTAIAAGPDVILSDIPSVASHGAVGGTYAYTLGSGTCNIGTANLEWNSNGSPGYAMNAFRLYDGRLEQIGMSWAKMACCVGNGPGCGMTCQSGGTGLRVGCRDVYSASWNSNQARMGPRSGIDAYGGAFLPIPGGTGDAIFRRLQIKEADMNQTTYPNALYFVEGVYASTGDSQAHNWYNNATYQRATFSPLSGYNLALADSVIPTVAAIYAWRDYGNGVGSPDNSVKIQTVDIPNEGRFIIASKVRDNGNGTWRYDYGIYNLCSHRSGGSFSVPMQSAVNLTSVGFHDVDYHSGEPYDNADWTTARQADSMEWVSPQTFALNPNSNALRWGTMYNFWFTANREPDMVQAKLGLFRPGTPDSVIVNLPGPKPLPCPGDSNASGNVDVTDLLAVINSWGPCAGCPADANGDGQVNVTDLLTVINNWGPCQ